MTNSDVMAMSCEHLDTQLKGGVMVCDRCGYEMGRTTTGTYVYGAGMPMSSKEVCPECGQSYGLHRYAMNGVAECPRKAWIEAVEGEKRDVHESDQFEALRRWHQDVDRSNTVPKAFNEMMDNPERMAWDAFEYGQGMGWGTMTDNTIKAEHDCTPFCTHEPTLSLMVIDLGESCVVKVEKGDVTTFWTMLWLKFRAPVGSKLTYTDGTQVVGYPFEKVREAIDGGEKPVPRIEMDNADKKGSYTLYEDSDTTEYIAKDTYDALSLITGCPLPVYEATGVWEELTEKPNVCFEQLPVTIWRYTRG